MINPSDVAILKEFWNYSKDFLLGFTGGVFSQLVPYYKNYYKGKAFVFGMLVTKVLLGAITSWIIGSGIDSGTPFRDMIVFLSGFFAFTVASILDDKFIKILVLKLTDKVKPR